MSTEVISPLPNQSVIRTHDGHDGHRHDDGRWIDRVIQRDVEVGFTAAALAGATNTAAINAAVAGASEEAQENFAVVQKQVSDAATATVVGFKDSLAIAYQVEGRSLLEAAKNANAASVQATMFANAAEVSASKNFYALSVEAVKNAAAAELRAQQIAAAAAAQAAECCCELKALITAEANTTRALINSNTVDELRNRLASIPRGVAVTIPVGV